jgi:metalloendopeptidase OMA1, mitochondrial
MLLAVSHGTSFERQGANFALSRPKKAQGRLSMVANPQVRCNNRHFLTIFAVLALSVGCSVEGEGPGHREQPLALSPQQELELGREGYREILRDTTVVSSGPEVDRVRRVTARIADAVRIEPLQREINLRLADYRFEWEYTVIVSDQVNAFCLPGGKIGVLTGLLKFLRTDDELAAVVSHEVAHALAHHASERIARARRNGGGVLRTLAYNRAQESEADHIGLFLVTFAGYDPEYAVLFWERMVDLRQQAVVLPEILSDHPNDQRRIEQLNTWIPRARAAFAAYQDGRIAPAPTRLQQRR